jgi:hypothetical protein
MMSALLKVYTDALHTLEVAHTAQNSTTTAGGTQAIGTTSLQVSSTANMPAQGVVDIDTGDNLETIPYTTIADTTHLTLAKATTISHASGVAVVQWYYLLAVGDQTNGISNDGTQATPTVSNVGAWYAYNAGDQIAQSPAFSTSSASPSTQDGITDTVISVTSSSSGFAASVSPSNIAVGGVQQFWVCEEVPTGQSNIPGTQYCVLNLQYQSV